MMDITYTHGNKVWRFAAVSYDADANLDAARLCVSGAANDVARKSLADYIQMTDDQKIIDTTKADPLAHFVARSVWAVIAPQEPVPVTARWTVPELGEQELFIPCGFLPPDENLCIAEWALEALMSDDESERWSAAYISTSERVQLFAIKDAEWHIRHSAVKTSTSERVHLMAMQDEDWVVRLAAAEKSTSESVHLLALQDEHWQVREMAAQTSTSERVHTLALQDECRDVRYAAKNNPAFKGITK